MSTWEIKLQPWPWLWERLLDKATTLPVLLCGLCPRHTTDICFKLETVHRVSGLPLNTNVITGLGMREVWTKAVPSMAV